jgi:hypothetical protein
MARGVHSRYVDVGSARAPGLGEVLVRNEYTTLCRSDLNTYAGQADREDSHHSGARGGRADRASGPWPGSPGPAWGGTPGGRPRHLGDLRLGSGIPAGPGRHSAEGCGAVQVRARADRGGVASARRPRRALPATGPHPGGACGCPGTPVGAGAGELRGGDRGRIDSVWPGASVGRNVLVGGAGMLGSPGLCAMSRVAGARSGSSRSTSTPRRLEAARAVWGGPRPCCRRGSGGIALR